MNLFNPYLVFATASLLTARAFSQTTVGDAVAVAPQPAPTLYLEASQEAVDRTEFTRTITKSIPVDSKAALSIENRFGDVSVSLWDRNEFRLQIMVTASSPDAGEAKKALNAVQIDERREGPLYAFKTLIDKEFESSQANGKESETQSIGDERTYPNGLKTSWKVSRKESGTILRISYRISMPKENSLTIKNSFGNTIIPDFWAPLSVSSKFGDVTGAALNSANTKIKASFGNVTIRELQNGNLDMAFGDLDINWGNVLQIEQKHGKLTIGETNKVDAKTSYGRTLIGAIKQSGTFKTKYAEQFRVAKLGSATTRINVESNYSSVSLPMQSTPNCDFDVTVTNGGFSYPNVPNLQLLAQPGPPPTPSTGVLSIAPVRPVRPNQPRQYVGRVGNGEGPTIKVVATYGDVRFNK
ncbi:hypothetical protein [Fibrella aquatica]|uniref:hypothetical protein n=1 Tax=Fibrella aquatica TaxID=3242487 RepID=UPI0035202459